MEPIFGLLGAFIPPILIFVFVVFILKLANKNLFKQMRAKFETQESMPEKNFRLGGFWHGKAQYNNAFIVGEKGKFLFIKFAFMRITLRIPFTDIKSAEAKKGMFGLTTIKLTFKDQKLKPITMRMNQKQLLTMPNLISLSGAEIEDPATINSTRSQHLAKKGSKGIYIKNTPADTVRKAILVIVLIGAAVALYAYYG